MNIPQLVAHRGYAACFPENTLLALSKAIDCGACFIEFDVQLCADGTPVLFHDTSLERTTGIQKNLLDASFASIKEIEAYEAEKFGNRFVGQGIAIPRLADIVHLLKSAPQVTAFVELKDESLQRHGVEKVLDIVLQIIQPVFQQCCIIAYDTSVIRAVQERDVHQTGWILKTWAEVAHQEARALAPDFLICNHQKIPSDATVLWEGPWFWCFYEVVEPELALALHARGAALIETMDIGGMLADPRLRPGGYFDNATL